MSESKTLVNGIDACPEQTVTVDQNNLGNDSVTEEQSSDLYLPPEPTNSPLADSTEASDSSSSWFTGLTSVVDSPNSYPNWCDSEAAVSSESSVSSGASKSSRPSSLVFDEDEADDEDEPPAKRQLLDHDLSTGDDVSTTTVFSPLLCQLLSISVEKSEQQSANDDTVDGSGADSATDGTDESPNTDRNVTPDDEVEAEQHEGSSDFLISHAYLQLIGYIITQTHTHTHNHSLDFVRANPGEPVPELTFTHSHLSRSSIIPYLLPPSTTIHGIPAFNSRACQPSSTIPL